MKIAEAFVELRVDSRGAEQDVRRQAQGLGSTFAQVFGAAAFGAGLKKAIDSGSKLEQSVGAIEAVFGKNQRTIDEWAKGAAKSMGLAESEAREALTLMGAQLKNFGFSVDEARDKGMGLVELAGDLAATFGGTTTEAVEALTAALRGEMDPIERYGVSLNDVRLKAKALEMGLYSGKGSLESNAKASAALALITEQTAAAHGQFARELDTVAGKQAVARAEAENSAATLGQNLAPVYERLVDLVGWLAEGFASLPAPLQYATVALIGVVALAGPMNSLRQSIQAATTAVQNMGRVGRTTTAALGALSAVVTVAILAYSAYNQRKQEAVERTNDLRDALIGEAGAQNEALVALAENDKAVRYFLEGAKELGVGAKEMAEYVRTGGGAVGELVQKLKEAEGAVDGAYPQLYEIAKAANAEEILQGAKNWEDWYHSVDQATFEAASNLRDWADEMVRLRDAEVAAQERQELVNAVTGEAADAANEAADAQAGLSDTLDTTAQKADATRLAIDDLATAFAGLLGTLDANDASRNAAEAMDRFRTASEEAYFAAITGAEDFEAKQRAAEQAADDLKRKVIAYGDEVGDLPAERVTDILALIDQGKLDEAQALLDELERARTVTFEVVVNGAGKKISFSPTTGVVALAEGGVMRRATPAIVGEAGPEAVLPLSRPGRMAEILADPSVAGPIAAAMGGGGAATNVYLTVNDYGTRRNWLAEVERELRRLKAGG